MKGHGLDFRFLAQPASASAMKEAAVLTYSGLHGFPTSWFLVPDGASYPQQSHGECNHVLIGR